MLKDLIDVWALGPFSVPTSGKEPPESIKYA